MRRSLRYHTTRFDPVGLWQLDGTLADTSGNGFDLTVNTGDEAYTDIAPGMLGAYFDGATTLAAGAGATALNITGDLTIECVIRPQAVDEGGRQLCIQHSGIPRAAEATNHVYALALLDPNNALALFNVSGGGLGTENTGFINDSIIPSTLNHLAVTRASDVITFYLNGVQIGTPQGPVDPSSGGGSGLFHLGGFTGEFFTGVLSSVKIVDRALTAVEVNDEAQFTVFGVTQPELVVFPVEIDTRGGQDMVVVSDVSLVDTSRDFDLSDISLWSVAGTGSASSTPQGTLLINETITHPDSVGDGHIQVDVDSLQPEATLGSEVEIACLELVMDSVVADICLKRGVGSDVDALVVEGNVTGQIAAGVLEVSAAAPHTLEIVRSGNDVWGLLDGVIVMQSRVPSTLGLVRLSSRSTAARARFRDFVVKPHATINGRLITSKTTVANQVLGKAPSAGGLDEVGDATVTVFGPSILARSNTTILDYITPTTAKPVSTVASTPSDPVVRGGT